MSGKRGSQRLKQTTLEHLVPISSTSVEQQYDEQFHELILRNEELKKEIDQTELYLFQHQRKRLPQPKPFVSRHASVINDEISSIGSKIILHHKYAKLEERLQHYLKCFGVIVKEHSENMCIVIFNIEIEGNPSAVYAVVFIKSPGTSSWKPKKYSLPPNFCLDELNEYQVMSMGYLRTMQEALKAHHSRLHQIKKLKDLLPSHVQIYECLNGKKVEIFLQMVSQETMNKPVDVVLIVKYNSFEFRPYNYTVSLNKITNGSDEVKKILKEQFEGLLNSSLDKAFIECIKKNESNVFYCPTDEELFLINTRQEKCRNQEYEDEETSVRVPDNDFPRSKNYLMGNLNEMDLSDDEGFSNLRKICSEQGLSKKKTNNKAGNLKKRLEREINMPQNSDDECEDYYDHSKVTKSKGTLKPQNPVEHVHQGFYDPNSTNGEESVYIPSKKKKNTENKAPTAAKKPKNTTAGKGRPKGSKNKSINDSSSTKKPSAKKTKK